MPTIAGRAASEAVPERCACMAIESAVVQLKEHKDVQIKS